MDEKKLEEQIELIATTTLGALKGIFKDNNLDDKQATLSLYYFLERFVNNGWKEAHPVDVLKNAIEVIEEQ